MKKPFKTFLGFFRRKPKTITTDDWNLMEDKVPNYYSLIIALVEDDDLTKCGYDFVCVWRASDDDGEDCYTICGTYNVLKDKIIKWAYLEIDDETLNKP